MRPRSDEPDALTESAFDRELKAALDVEPSPEFLARVRTQLASEPEPSAWRHPWLFAAASAVAILVVAVVVTSRLDDPGKTEVVQALKPVDPVVAQNFRSAVPDAGVAEAAPSDSVVVRTFRSAVADSVTQTLRPAVADSKLLEVIISPDEVRGLRRLIAMANEGDTSLESLLAGPTVLATVGPEGEITLPPITIDPLIPETDSDTQ